jgi:hypothetical protein
MYAPLVPSDPCVPEQRSGAPRWDTLHQEVAAFCRRTQAELVVELAKHDKDVPERDVVVGALEFCAEVPAILDSSDDWSAAWGAVAKAGGSVLSTDRRKVRRNMGGSQVKNYVLLALQTGQIRDFELSLRIPRSLQRSDSVLEESRKKTRARGELQRRAQGLTAPDVDRLIDQIWAQEGLEAPTLPQRHMLIERAIHPPSRLDQLRTTADVLAGGTRWVSRIVKVLRNGEVDEVPDDHMRVRSGDDSVQVILDARADRHVAALHDPLGISSRTMSTVQVQLRSGPDGTVEVWEPPSALPHPIRLGVIESDEADPFLPILTDAERIGRVAVCQATRFAVPPPDGPSRLYVSVPDPDGSIEG